MPYIGRSINTGEFKIITLSESFDGSRVDFTMSESVGNVNQLIVILSGIVQHWSDAFTISNNILTFSSAPASGETIKILKLGDTNNIGVPSDSSVTADKLASTLNLSSKTLTLPASSVTAHVSQYDDNKIQSNIALLGFKIAVNGSLAKYVLKDQVVDEYTNSTGLDSSASANQTLNSGGFSGSAIPAHSADSATTVGSDTLLTFSTAQSTTVTFTSTTSVEYLVVGGGGAGGFGNAGGGGAGGYLANGTKNLSMAGGTAYTITVGAGGVAAGSGSVGGSGGNSSIAGSGLSTLLADGGGGGHTGSGNGANGGSGGGGGYHGGSGGSATGNGLGNAGGGQTTAGPNHGAGGGGGSAGAGQNGTNNNAGDGGAGTANDITGSSVTYASGGGASANNVGASINGSGGSSGAGRGIGGDGDGDITLADATVFGCGGGGVYNHSGGRGGHGAGGVVYLLFTSAVTDMTLQSTDATASTAPTKADFVMLMENVSGTATLNTDIKAYISRDSGANFTQGTLVEEGTYDTNKKIIAFHDLDISGQPSGTSICYKITTHNQSTSKETRVHATSYGWS